MRDLGRLLHPKSITVFGATWAENVIRQCDRIGYAGEIWPVHPRRDEIAGRPCFRAVADLPGSPDAAFIGVNRHATLEVIEALRARGCGGAVCFASGFAETGDHALQETFVECAGDMPVLGPNCYGLINCLDGAMIWPDQQGCRRVERGVAILTQSSNIGITLTMQRRGLPVAYLACLGNAAQTGVSELAGAFLADPRVTALGVFLEGVGDARAFARVVAAARDAGKGVVVLKAGRSAGGQAAAMTHTASLAGGAVASSAYLRQIGAGEVTSIPELVEALKILHAHGPLSARRYISVSCSGGEAGLVADAAEGRRIAFPPVPARAAKRLSELLGPLVNVSNPFDYHTFIWGDGPKMTDVFATALDAFDAALYVIDPPRHDTCDRTSYEPAFAAMIAAARRAGKPAFALATLPDTIDEALAERLWASGLVPLLGVHDALAGLEAASAAPPVPGWSPWPGSEPRGRLMDEAAAKAILAEAGVKVPRFTTAETLDALSLDGLTPPFALKGLGLAHKSEAGAVRLGVRDPCIEAPMPGARGYLAEEMVEGAVAEMLVGLRRDPVYGATLTIGSGGVEAELLADTVTLIVPVGEDAIADALRRLRLWPLLDGYRGRARADSGAVVEVALRLQALLESRPDLTEVEVNPLMVLENGAVAADALIRKEER